MIHSPHSKDNTCSKNFPKKFCEFTEFEENRFPKYCRRNNSFKNFFYNKKINGQEINVDYSMVVPYNLRLLKEYNCHINTEYCVSLMATKYLFKYLRKGHDRAYFKIKKKSNIKIFVIENEITEYGNAKYVSDMESAWKIEELSLIGRSHTVIRLAINLENQQHIIFDENNVESALEKHETTLTTYFKLNTEDVDAKNYFYANIPQNYYDISKKKWVKKNTQIALVDLRTYEGITFNTFRETAIAMGFVECDGEIFKIFDKACAIMMPKQLRQNFAWFVLTNNSFALVSDI